MKKELKRLWIEALKSGEYEQGEGALKVSQKYDAMTDAATILPKAQYCCLGVLADVAIKNGFLVEYEGKWVGETFFIRLPDDWDESENLGGEFELTGEFESLKVMELFGLPQECHDRGIGMNDGDSKHGIEQANFVEIAEWMEENLPEE